MRNPSFPARWSVIEYASGSIGGSHNRLTSHSYSRVRRISINHIVLRHMSLLSLIIARPTIFKSSFLSNIYRFLVAIIVIGAVKRIHFKVNSNERLKYFSAISTIKEISYFLWYIHLLVNFCRAYLYILMQVFKLLSKLFTNSNCYVDLFASS